jgi:hypothetical protein
MRAIFISYRRNDAEGQAGRLFDDLTQHFGDDSVFMDVAAIEAGRDFRRVIDEQVASCGVLLAIIGKNWLTETNEAGMRRLDDPMDFVRLETASALKRDIPVVPVMVQGARMPRADELPDNLKELPYRNGVELTHARWDSDLQLLIKALRPFVQPKSEATSPTAPLAPPPSPRPLSRVAIAICVGVLAAGLGGYMLYKNSAQEPNRVSGNPEQGVGNSEKPKPEMPRGEIPTPLSANVPGGTVPGGKQTDPQTSPPGGVEHLMTFRDWEGSWDLKWEFEGQTYGRVMNLKSGQSGIAGDYEVGILDGRFVAGDFSKVSGEITNTTNTGTTCSSGKQSGVFSLTLASDGKSMEGWWDVCGEGTRWPWKAAKR